MISCSNLMSFLKNAILMKSTFGHMASAQNMLPEYGHRSVVGLRTAICPNTTCDTAAAWFLDGGDKSCCCIPSSSRIFFCGCESGDAIAQHYIWWNGHGHENIWWPKYFENIWWPKYFKKNWWPKWLHFVSVCYECVSGDKLVSRFSFSAHQRNSSNITD